MFGNLLLVWFLTGLWHGAGWNFIAWGLGYFALIAFEKSTGWPERFKNSIFKAVYRILTLLFINFEWVLFRAANLTDGISFIKNMCIFNGNTIASQRAWFLLEDYRVFLIAALVFATPVIPFLKRVFHKRKAFVGMYDTLTGIAVTGCFVIAVSLVVSGQYNPFLYANF